MQLLVSDANILIDLEEGELIDIFFQLPYQISVTDILFAEELEEQHAHLLGMGLMLGELAPNTMLYAETLIQGVSGPSRNDCFALALAKQEGCPLLTGDQALRKVAEREAVVAKGTIWVVEELIRCGLLSLEGARKAYQRMKGNGRRLPWSLAEQRLENLKPSGVGG